MKIFLFQDQASHIDLRSISSALASITGWEVCVGNTSFPVPSSPLSIPASYEQLPQKLIREASSASMVVLITDVPYDNNYFIDPHENFAILSLYAWEQLTDLPRDNGVVYFLASLLRSYLPIGERHENTTGCIHDFLWDKRGIDLGMRAGRFCSHCIHRMELGGLQENEQRLFEATKVVLSDLASASIAGLNISQVWKDNPPAAKSPYAFDVFLCHNSKDKPDVRKVLEQLKAKGVSSWIDEEQLRPGLPWQEELEGEIANIGAAAVFVGESGIGPWQDVEMRAFLNEFANRRCPVIPIILASALRTPELPMFLRAMTWVDFRTDCDTALERLVWGVTGKR